LIRQITTLFISEALYYAIKNWTRQYFAWFFLYTPDFKAVRPHFLTSNDNDLSHGLNYCFLTSVSNHFFTPSNMNSAIDSLHIAFIGGGNMANAIIGGLLKQGLRPHQIQVVEPFEDTALKLREQFDIAVLPAASIALAQADLMVWAVKPQVFKEAAEPVLPFASKALHLSVAAGIRTDSIASWLQSTRVVRCMPNTPALVGKGITALFALAHVSDQEKSVVEHIIRTTGEFMWVKAEKQLDAVTALSGSGPAYVFYFLEAMTQAGVGMGLNAEQAYHLAVATFAGASELARASDESADVLRQRVTSKGGTTYAAISSMETAGIKTAFIAAMQAAEQRAGELGDEFGKA